MYKTPWNIREANSDRIAAVVRPDKLGRFRAKLADDDPELVAALRTRPHSFSLRYCVEESIVGEDALVMRLQEVTFKDFQVGYMLELDGWLTGRGHRAVWTESDADALPR